MTTYPTTATGDALGSEVVPSAAITRLFPQDGLFLRAEHLAQMQSYTRELSRALARAGGSGVAYGLTAGFDSARTRITVTDGLAFDPAGATLLLESAQELVPPTADAATSFWVIELVAAERPVGAVETVFSTLGDCGSNDAAGSARPYVSEGLRIVLRPVQLPLPAQIQPNQLRNALASAYFERERIAGGALIATSAADTPGAALTGSAWATGTGVSSGSSGTAGSSGPAAVPIGVLLHTDTGWQVDVWMARRDRIDPPARRGWQQRLGHRPADVFLAQVLQFQAQLATMDLQSESLFTAISRAVTETHELLELASKGGGNTVGRKSVLGRADDLMQSLAAVQTLSGVSGGRQVLLERGFVELPPAGYLPVDPGLGAVNEQVRRLLGDTVKLRFRAVRPDQVALALEHAQHLDRISLTAGRSDLRARPDVDILVPDGVPTGAVAAGDVHFAKGTVGFENAGDNGSPYQHPGLARFEKDGTGRIRVAFAGFRPASLEQETADAALWADLQIDPDPFLLTPGTSSAVQLRVAWWNSQSRRRGEAVWRGDLSADLVCGQILVDDKTGRVEFQGRLVGGASRRQASMESDDFPIDVPVQLTAERSDGRLNRVRLQVGAWELPFALTTTAPVQVSARSTQIPNTNVTVLCDLTEDPMAVHPGQPARTSAEAALKELGGTEFPTIAPSRLFAEGSSGTAATGLGGPHNWVLFTRRADCGCDSGVDGRAVVPLRLDLYTLDAGIREPIGGTATGARFVDTLEWDGGTFWLSADSDAVLEGWAHPATGPAPAAPVGAGVWLSVAAPYPFIVRQALNRMGADDASQLPVKLLAGNAPVNLSPRSVGAILVRLAPAQKPDPGLVEADPGKV